MRFVVTGGSGVLGGAIVDALIEQGHEVTALDVKWPKRRRDPDRCRYVLLDLTERRPLYEHFDGAAGVCHAGAIPGAWDIFDSEPYRNNMMSTFHVFAVAVDLKVPRVVNVSSVQACGLFGSTPNPLPPPALPIDETFEIVPRNCYGLAKRHGERLGDMAVDHYSDQLSVISLRFPLIIRNTPRVEQHILRQLEGNWGRNDFWTVISNREAGEVCARSLVAPLEGHHAFFAHGRHPLASMTWRQLREEHFPEIEWRSTDPEGCLVSHARMESVLGWIPDKPVLDYFDPERRDDDRRF